MTTLTTFISGDFNNQFADPNQQALAQWLQQMEAARRADYDLFRAYYGGDHPTRLTDRLKRFLGSDLQFRDNFMEVVVDALAERLIVTSFGTQEESAEKPVSAWAWNTWQANRMDETQAIVHMESVMVGDAYVLVDWDTLNQRPRITHQLPEMIIPHYNEATRQIDFASKKWVETPIGEDPTTRLNMYYPDRVEKYIATGSRWVEFREEDENIWPQPTLDRDGMALGVAMFHFRNRPAGSDFGHSEIASAIHLQDLLNKTLIDLAMLNDNAGFGRAYTVNIAMNRSALDMLPGMLLELHGGETGDDFAVGTIPADSPDGILKSLDLLVQHISGTTRTPHHLFFTTGGNPSGEALKTAESGLVKKVVDRQVRFGNTWEDVMAFAHKLEGVFGSSPGELTERFNVGWADPETRNEVAHLEALEKKRNLGVSQTQILRELGYDQATIEQMQEDEQEERVRGANLGSALLRSFTAGDGAGV
ncbi:hypothetical protein CMI37_14390 [Candidatus Pacearchaeota archaeon]|nr:hypothetical protein [Candidatus Pacearchaeota archaeon]